MVLYGIDMGGATIKNCKNYGNITYVSGNHLAYGGAGGIGGSVYNMNYSSPIGRIENCYNEGKIKSEYFCGGIVGCGADVDINKCKNIGEVDSGGQRRCGGILGNAWRRRYKYHKLF